MTTKTLPMSLPPNPTTAPVRLKLPAGAWDCHTHVVGPADHYPWDPDREYDSAVQTGDELIAMLDTLGLSHAVLVQASVHGTDNSYMADVIRANRNRLRGVAAVQLDASENVLADLKEAGVVALRLLDAPSGAGTNDLEKYADLCKEIGWHMEFCAAGSRILELEPRLKKLNVKLVIDHLGRCPVAEGISGDAFQAVLRLLEDESRWVKIAAWFRRTDSGAPYEDTWPFAAALVEKAPNRCIWGSDWPHLAIRSPARLPSTGPLLDFVADGIPDEAARRRVLVDNPTRLYGRPAG